ncbi:axin 1 [Paragonimus westermani]|uniref:Axin 1 n=1 Tax=Paragonimus westermani TaxID=34504 RepID=A0A5J4NKD8_9TREM|nr:axin 1 [Paragonimus westermani]
MSYPPETSRSCHEADGRSDRSGGSGGAAGGSSSGGGVYGTLHNTMAGGKWPVSHNLSDPSCLSLTGTTDRLVSNWKKWSLGLDYLLQDSEGVALFKSYLQYEGCSNLLDFWFACQGFRSKVDPSDHRKITQLIKAIYRTYIRGSGSNAMGLTSSSALPNMLSEPRNEPIRLRTETKRMISERISRKHALDQTVFDPAQAEVEQFLRATAYPAFLKSDIYIDFLQTTLEGSGSKLQAGQMTTVWSGCLDASKLGTVTGLTECSAGFAVGGNILPTLEEDKELISEELPCHMDSAACAARVAASGPYPMGTSCGPLFLGTQTRPRPPHCPHCSQYHSQGHQSPCAAADLVQRYIYPPSRFYPSGPRPPPFFTPAPLTMGNLQMTRFHRTDLSLHNHPSTGPGDTRSGSHEVKGGVSGTGGVVHCGRENPYHHGYETKVEQPRAHLNYLYTHWADAVCPPQTLMVPPADSRLSTNCPPSQPPNPYHISYAPVSARDSERHSLSSEARTDDTHSHTDSSHRADDGLDCSYTSPKPRPSGYEDAAHSPQKRVVNLGVSAGPSQPLESEHLRSHVKHQRRAMRRGLTGWRSADRGKSVAATGNCGVGDSPGPAAVTSKSIARSHNVAEKDPPTFFRLLSEKLQRVLDNQLAMERLDQLMTETSPNPPHSTSEQSPEQGKPAVHSFNTDDSVSYATTTTGNAGVAASQQSDEPVVPSGSSVLQRPWADRLLAAARAILEDHCSRIWAASADRTPTSSGSGSGGGGNGGAPSHALEELEKDSHGRDLTRSQPNPVGARRKLTSDSAQPGTHVSVFPHSAPRESPSGVGTTSVVTPAAASGGMQNTNRQEDLATVGTLPMRIAESKSVHSPSILVADSHKSSSARSHKTYPASSSGSPSTSLSPFNDRSIHGPPSRRRPYPLPMDDRPAPANITAPATCASSTNTTSSVVSTSTPGLPASSPSSGSSHSLVIGYYLGEDPVPYRSVWPSAEITLGQFKQLIPKKKGSFRYFFKKFSNEFGSGVVHQEITNDNCVLPLWEGKVVAKVERID